MVVVSEDILEEDDHSQMEELMVMEDRTLSRLGTPKPQPAMNPVLSAVLQQNQQIPNLSVEEVRKGGKWNSGRWGDTKDVSNRCREESHRYIYYYF